MTPYSSRQSLSSQYSCPTSRTYLACVGTRPEIIKMAPVYQQLRATGNHVMLVHTGQHGVVANALYAFFGMSPDIVIDLQRKFPSLAHLTTALLDGIDDSLHALKPDVILVQGDTTSALAGTVAGFYHDIPVAHVEAGLRTFAREPFPEEKNRELIGRLARWHFPPTARARGNLLAEGIKPSLVFEVGNTVIDATRWACARIGDLGFDLAASIPPALQRFRQRHAEAPLLLVTAHRRENWGQPIADIATALITILTRQPDAVGVWPLHPNPAVRAVVVDALEHASKSVRERICLTEPLEYPALIDLLSQCRFTLTDSGGIQEEASALAKPVLIARTCTERQELVDAGGAILVGTDFDCIVLHAERLLRDRFFYQRMQLRQSPFGDGAAGRRIADILSGTEGTATDV